MKKLIKSITCIFIFTLSFTLAVAKGAQETSTQNAKEVLSSDSTSNQTQTSTQPQQTTTQVSTNTQSTTKNKATSIIQAALPSISAPASQGFTNDEAIQALKEALIEAAMSSSDLLSKENAYFKNPLYYIDLPSDAENLVKVVSKLPGGKSKIDDVILRLNRTAEESAAEIIPIFKEAVTNMSFQDATAIVTGKDDAATQYLKRTTYNQLVSLYKPRVNAALDKKLVGSKSANEAWASLVTTYNKTSQTTNKVGAVFGKEVMQEVNTDLAQYATEKALDAVFLQMAEEEGKIRKDPMDYASSIIRKVFGAKR